jgi:hypothetical protein
VIGGVTGLKFIPSAPFRIGVVLTNSASKPVTLTDVRAVLPHGSVVRQLGTALATWVAPPPCLGILCGPAPDGGLQNATTFGALRPSPLVVAPGKGAAVQLNFRFLGCPDARHASLRTISRIEVSFKDSAGTTVLQRLALGNSTLKINRSPICSK